MLIARAIFVWVLCVIGVAGLLGCGAAMFVPPSRLARVVHSSNVLHADGWQTSVLRAGVNRSGFHLNALRRDWGREEPIFNSAWESTDYGFDEGVMPGSSVLGFEWFFHRNRNASGGGIVKVSGCVPLWCIGSMSLMAVV